MWNKRENVVAVTCLVVGSVGQLVQYVVSPVNEGASAAKNVAKALAHPTAMQCAAWLDLSILFFLPALVVVAHLTRARTTRLGWVAAVLAIGTAIPGIAYVLAPDVLLVEAAQGHITADAIDKYNSSGVVGVATAIFLIGHVVGMVLLALALWRVQSVPRWAAAALALSPVLEVAGAAGEVKVVGVIAYALLIAAFGACAVALLRADTVTSDRPEAVMAGR